MKQKISALLLALVSVAALILPSTVSAQNASKSGASLVKSAYNRVEELVNAKTFMVVRVDMTAIDPAALTLSLDTLFANFVKDSKFDADKIKAARREFHVALEALQTNLDAAVTPTDDLKLREIFIIVQSANDESTRVFIPGVKQPLQQLFGMTGSTVKVNNGVAFATNAAEDAKIYKNFKPSANTGLRSFFENDATGTIQVYISSLSLNDVYKVAYQTSSFEPVKLNDVPEVEIPAEAKAGADAFASYFQNFHVCIDLNKLTVDGGFVFTTAERAETARKGLEILVNKAVDESSKSETCFGLSKEASEKYNLPALELAVKRASMQKIFVPNRAANSLRFEFTPDAKDFWSNTSILFLPFGL